MRTLRQDVLYALRQMRLSPVFTLTAMLTLALGIGATTAIFSLIHTVMLKSLPVADPASLYRIGDGTDCCVEGSPQTNWGMYSYRLYQQFVAAAPEFEQLTAFQAGGSQFSVRKSETDQQAKPRAFQELPDGERNHDPGADQEQAIDRKRFVEDEHDAGE